MVNNMSQTHFSFLADILMTVVFKIFKLFLVLMCLYHKHGVIINAKL